MRFSLRILVGYLRGGDYETFWRCADVAERVAGDESNRGLRSVGKDRSVIAVDDFYGSDLIVVVVVERLESDFVSKLNSFEITKIGVAVSREGSVSDLARVGGFGDVTDGEIESVGVGAFFGDGGNVEAGNFENAKGRCFFPELVSGCGVPGESSGRCRL